MKASSGKPAQGPLTGNKEEGITVRKRAGQSTGSPVHTNVTKGRAGSGPRNGEEGNPENLSLGTGRQERIAGKVNIGG